MTKIELKKIIFFIYFLLLSNQIFAENLQYFVNQASIQTLTGPYAYYQYQPASMMNKAIENLPSYSNFKKCSRSDVSDAIIILKPILFYNPQSTILYGDLNIKVYQSRSKNETNPDNFIKNIKISLWRVIKYDEVTASYYINEIYTDLLKKLTSEIDSLKIDKNYPTNGSYCDLLSTINKSSINLNY